MSAPQGQLYVYGIVAAEEAPDAAGLGPGVFGDAVECVAACGLVALASPAPPGNEPIDPTRRRMLLHTKLLERVLANATVLPLRFGTVAPDRAALLRCLQSGAPRFRAALGDIAGRIELGVKASWRDGVVFEDIVATDPALRALRDRLQRRSAAETYYERIELGRAVEAALAQHRAAEAATILGVLGPLAERVAELKTLDDQMILNRAFLVRREAERAFDAAIDRLGTMFEGRMVFRYVGPVPPYNFVAVRTEWAAAA
jgi:hypothetical protein